MNIDYHKPLSEKFIREFQDKVNWKNISYSQILSEEFIREFQNEVDWEKISFRQKLSEDFIREFKDKVNWGWISIKQKLSESFMREFQNKIYWEFLIEIYGYKLEFLKNNKYQIQSNNYCSNLLDFQELINLTLKFLIISFALY